MSRLFLFILLAMGARAFGQCIDQTIDYPGSKWRDAGSQPDFSKMLRHSGPPNKITIHYTGVKKNPNQGIVRKLKGLVNFSKNNLTEFKKKLWGDMPYNYYIDMDGKSAEGRDVGYRPDTNTQYNPDRHVTIVVEGDNTDDLSPVQRSKLFAMIKGLQNKFSIPTRSIGIHKHYASTDCPGEEITAAIKEYKRQEKNFVPNSAACGNLSTPVLASPKPKVSAPSAGKSTTSPKAPTPARKRSAPADVEGASGSF